MTPFTLALVLLPAAPAPVARPPRPLQVLPGRYSLTWGGTIYNVTMRAGGRYEATGQGCCWVGYWSWSKAARVLTVQETGGTEDGGSYFLWGAELDGRLEGTCGNGVRVILRRVK